MLARMSEYMFPGLSQSHSWIASAGFRRALIATASAGGHLAVAGLLATTAAQHADQLTDAVTMAVDVVEADSTIAPAVRHESTEPYKLASVPMAVAKSTPTSSAVETVSNTHSTQQAEAIENPTASPPPSNTATARASEALMTVPARFDADYLNNPKPVYPSYARRLGEHGEVQLQVLVNAAGQPESITLKASSGSRRLDEAALEAVRRWRFVPARQGSMPVQSWVTVLVVFNLEG
ncbi:hypothetical protein B9N43_00455 [Denitratisoma sp. DHT3]|nr:hypothetical protein B9N43_00455 [Denitratisoma sp. DHT3]